MQFFYRYTHALNYMLIYITTFIFITGHMTLVGIHSHLLILATLHFLYPQQAPQQVLVLHLIGVTHIVIPGEYEPFIALSGLGRSGFSLTLVTSGHGDIRKCFTGSPVLCTCVSFFFLWRNSSASSRSYHPY